jgi:predicted house-cleaning noncanonical NTP pyrophosphatase (MazG superfamily)
MKENEMHRLLETAQATYGYANQVVVAIEELCELGAVLSKYPRYDFHDDAVEALRDKVLEETADAIIVLRHIQMIFGLQPNEIDNMMDKKLNRLKRWLEDDNKSFQHTTEDRAVGEDDMCPEDCPGWEHFELCREHCPGAKRRWTDK